MNQASPKIQPKGNWYLFIGDGICLKVSSDLVLGEDDDGLVVLNPKQPGYGLLKMRRDDDGRLLLKNISKRHVLDWQTGTATMVGSEFALVAGSKVVLPNNELYLNHEMQRGQVSARIVVQESDPVVEQVEVLVEVMPESPAPTAVVPESPQPDPITSEQLLDQEVFAEPLAHRSAVPEVASPKRDSRIVLIGLAVSLCLAVGLLIGTWFSTPASQEPVAVAADVPPVPEQTLPVRAEPVPIEGLPVETAETQSAQTEPEMVEVAADEPAPVEPVTRNSGAIDPAVAAGLERATTYLQQGLITQPEDGNAVQELSNILWQDPTNKEAFDLMGEATTRLIDAAVEAHSAGFEYEARNLIEEVLGFNPQHPQANAYKQEWAGN
ncbi:MAG: hypothetical protein NXH95_03390 [Pseudomonadaceae bacterium]|nr:hypothetical protein [Pseudomonadaceae bacterium]